MARLRRQGVPGDVEVPPLAGVDAPPLPLAAVGVAAGSACAPLAAVVLAAVTPAAAGTTGVPSTAAAAPGCRVEAAVLPPDVALPSLRLELARVLARDDMLTRVGARFRWWRFWTVGGRCECEAAACFVRATRSTNRDVTCGARAWQEGARRLD